MTDFDQLAASLRVWAAGDWVCSAAVELLITNSTWLRRADFEAACIEVLDDDFARIDWEAAQAFAASGPGCSPAEGGFLRLAVAIGADEFRLMSLDEGSRAAAVRALAAATRMEGMLRG